MSLKTVREPVITARRNHGKNHGLASRSSPSPIQLFWPQVGHSARAPLRDRRDRLVEGLTSSHTYRSQKDEHESRYREEPV
jgi:hypothetical protein